MSRLYLLWILTLTGLLACASNPVLESQKATVSQYVVLGDVVFSSGGPVVGATITTDPPTRTLVTDSNGQFRIEQGLDPLKYTFKAEFEKRTGTAEAVVQEGIPTMVQIELDRKKTLDLINRDENHRDSPFGRGGESRTGP